MRIAAVAALALCVGLQAGCDRAAEPAPEPAAPPIEAASGPAPASVPVTITIGRFDAISNTAMGVTGDLTASSAGFAFAQGQTYALVGVGEAKGADPYATTGASFASLINVPEAASLKLFRVVREDPAKARNGGFCGADPTTFIVAHEGVDSGGAPALSLVAFKGAAPPSANSPETDLCGTFMYAPSPAAAATK